MILNCSDPASCWASQEFAGARVWDRRCLKSLSRIADSLSRSSSDSFSRACGHTLRQCAHRIFEHKTTTVAGLLAGHIEQTRARASGQTDEDQGSAPKSLILVIQDTTDFDYSKHFATEGLGPICSVYKQGLFAHSALAATPRGLPLGVVHLDIWARKLEDHGKKKLRASTPIEEKESYKWIRGLHGIEAAFDDDQPLLMVADRECDIYELFAEPRRSSTHLLVRANYPRRVTVEGKATTLTEAVHLAPVVGSYSINVPRKPAVPGSAGEKERVATLEVRYCELTLPAPRTAARNVTLTPSVCVRVVQVSEVETNAPEDSAPADSEQADDEQADGSTPGSSSTGSARIDWMLITTLPIDNFESARQLVQYYTCRWTIERLHYTLKSGMRAERLQFDDAKSLKHALALLYVVAWRLLLLLYISRLMPDAPAAHILEPTALTVLGAVSRRAITTAREVNLEIAKLGGYEYYPSASPPGIKSLWLGLRRLDDIVVGFQLAAKGRNYA